MPNCLTHPCHLYANVHQGLRAASVEADLTAAWQTAAAAVADSQVLRAAATAATAAADELSEAMLDGEPSAVMTALLNN